MSATLEPTRAVLYGAVFAASRARVRSVPLAVWRHLLALVSHDAAPEAVHFLERAWHSLLSVFPTRTDAEADADDE